MRAVPAARGGCPGLLAGLLAALRLRLRFRLARGPGFAFSREHYLHENLQEGIRAGRRPPPPPRLAAGPQVNPSATILALAGGRPVAGTYAMPFGGLADRPRTEWLRSWLSRWVTSDPEDGGSSHRGRAFVLAVGRPSMATGTGGFAARGYRARRNTVSPPAPRGNRRPVSGLASSGPHVRGPSLGSGASGLWTGRDRGNASRAKPRLQRSHSERRPGPGIAATGPRRSP